MHLSTSNTPLWARNPWIGPLFGVSEVSTGAAATRMLLKPKQRAITEKPLERVESVGRLAEAATLAGYLASAGTLAEPLTKGRYAAHLWGGVVGAGLVASAVTETVAGPRGRT